MKDKIIKGFRNVYDIDRLRIDIEAILSGNNYLSFLRDNDLKGLTVHSLDDKKKYSVDFTFLENISYLEYFECLVPLFKQSDIKGLYLLHNLKYLRWIVDNKFELDYSKLPSLEVLVTSYYEGMKNWDSLTNLKVFHISKLKKDDCTFISNLKELTDLKLNRAEITSLKGLEKCEKLERLELAYCSKIEELTSILKSLPNIISLSLRKCKNINRVELDNIRDLGISLWVE